MATVSNKKIYLNHMYDNPILYKIIAGRHPNLSDKDAYVMLSLLDQTVGKSKVDILEIASGTRSSYEKVMRKNVLNEFSGKINKYWKTDFVEGPEILKLDLFGPQQLTKVDVVLAPYYTFNSLVFPNNVDPNLKDLQCLFNKFDCRFLIANLSINFDDTHEEDGALYVPKYLYGKKSDGHIKYNVVKTPYGGMFENFHLTIENVDYIIKEPFKYAIWGNKLKTVAAKVGFKVHSIWENQYENLELIQPADKFNKADWVVFEKVK